MSFFKNFITDEYAIVYRSVPEDGALLFQNGKTMFQSMPNCKRYWYADPMLFEHEGKQYLFMEAYDKKADLGRIACCEIKEDGTFSRIVNILSEDYHLSYPNVFKIGDAVYMIPESSGSNAIWLYECLKFPVKWRKSRVLLEGKRMVDSTLFEAGGKRWLFSAEKNTTQLHGTSLNLYEVTENLQLTPHRQNPVVTDIAAARPAGNVFTFNGELIRPSQDCSGGNYGRALNFHKITSLDGEPYREELLATVTPEKMITNIHKKLTGCHTYAISEDGRLEVVDVKYEKIDILLGLKITVYNIQKKLRLIH